MRPLSLSCLVLLALMFSSHRAQAEANPYVAVYELSIGVLKLGVMRRTLDIKKDGTYIFESAMETSGLAALLHPDRVRETSRGRIVDGRFAPDHYLYDNSRKKRRYELIFDYVNGVVKRGDTGADWTAPLDAAVLDKLVYQVQLMQDLPTKSPALNYRIADKDKLKTYLIESRGSEEISTPHGRYATLRLERTTDDARRRTTVWCAEALGWLPVRVDYQDKDGTVTTAKLREYVSH